MDVLALVFETQLGALDSIWQRADEDQEGIAKFFKKMHPLDLTSEHMLSRAPREDQTKGMLGAAFSTLCTLPSAHPSRFGCIVEYTKVQLVRISIYDTSDTVFNGRERYIIIRKLLSSPGLTASTA